MEKLFRVFQSIRNLPANTTRAAQEVCVGDVFPERKLAEDYARAMAAQNFAYQYSLTETTAVYAAKAPVVEVEILR